MRQEISGWFDPRKVIGSILNMKTLPITRMTVTVRKMVFLKTLGNPSNESLRPFPVYCELYCFDPISVFAKEDPLGSPRRPCDNTTSILAHFSPGAPMTIPDFCLGNTPVIL